MTAGKLRKRVQVQQNNPGAVDSMGAPIPNWQPWATVWAEVRSMAGYERYISDEVRAAARIVVEIRYLAGLMPWHRFQYLDDVTGKTRIFTPYAIVDVEERHIWMQVACTEEVAAELAPATTPAPTSSAPTSAAPSTGGP
jgi:SPP1 family predicted phage head-tail adaptor